MTPRQLREFRKRLGLTQAAFAECLSVAPNTDARWERGELGMRPSTKLLIQMLMRDTDLTRPALANARTTATAAEAVDDEPSDNGTTEGRK